MIDKPTFAAWHAQLSSEPRTLGLPHDELRPGQLDALGKMRPVINGHIPFSFWEKPTGTGKSAISAALAYLAPVTVLVHRRSLSNQYAREYGFAALHGKDEYECVLPDKQKAWAMLGDDKPTAADCHYSKMADCPVSHMCPYLMAKRAATRSRKAVFTSRMALLNGKLRNDRDGLWIIDECHSIVEESLGYAQETIKLDELRRYRLHFAEVLITGRQGLLEPTERQYLCSWLLGCASAIVVTQSESKENARAKKLRTRFERLAIELSVGAWFITYDGHTLILQGLDAKGILDRIWSNKRPTLLISATIGKVDSLASMAGIEDYTYESYPHPVPVEYRPIFDLGLPSMSHKNLTANPGLLQEQMEASVAWIRTLPDHLRGMIVTTSNKRVEYCREYLAYHLPERFYMAPGSSVNERTYNLTHCETPGIIAGETLSGFGTGVDWRLGDLVIVAGTQFFNRGDAFSLARLELMAEQGTTGYEPWLAYLGNTQALGRTVRGLKDEKGRYLYKPCALADGLSTTWRAKREYPASMLEAIRPL